MRENDVSELDVDYIDQLLTTYIPPEERPPAPPPAEASLPEPPEEPVEEPVPAVSEKARLSPVRVLLLFLAALILLSAGFFAGRIVPPEETVPTGTTTIPTTVPDFTVIILNPSFGVVPDYTYMSTAELAVRACKISKLIDYVQAYSAIEPAFYGELAEDNYVLVELVRREDAIPMLENIAATSSIASERLVANALVVFFQENAYYPVTPDTDPVDPGIATDYVSMSTAVLVNLALQLDDLSGYGVVSSSLALTPDTYAQIAANNPVLLELQQRPDAVEELSNACMLSSSLSRTQIASTLICYFTAYLGYSSFIPWD